MSRLNLKKELFDHITEVGVFRDAAGGGSTTSVGASAADGIGTFVLTSATNFAQGDYFRIRAPGETCEINRITTLSTATVTPAYHLGAAIAAGDAIVEVSRVPLGHIEKDGLGFALSAGNEDVQAANRVLTLSRLLGYLKLEVDFKVLGWNLENIATSLGMLDTSANITGTGTTADPNRLWIDGAKLREQNDLSWYVLGSRKDGRTIELQLYGCELDYTKLQMQLKRGGAVPLPVQLAPTGGYRLIEID